MHIDSLPHTYKFAIHVKTRNGKVVNFMYVEDIYSNRVPLNVKDNEAWFTVTEGMVKQQEVELVFHFNIDGKHKRNYVQFKIGYLAPFLMDMLPFEPVTIYTTVM